MKSRTDTGLDILIEVIRRCLLREDITTTTKKRLLSGIAQISWTPLPPTLVINKFYSKGVQDHATYLPGWVCKYVLGLTPLIFK